MSRHRTAEQLAKHRERERQRRAALTPQGRKKEQARKAEWYQANRERTAAASKVAQAKYRTGGVPELDRDTCIYLAGLFDGEGCFMISTTLYRGKATYNPSVRIAMTDRDVIEWLGQALDRPVAIHGLGAHASPNAKTVYRVVLQNAVGIISFTSQILPFLRVKRSVAERLIAFCESRLQSRKDFWAGKAYSSEEVELSCQIKTLNRVGREAIEGENEVRH